MTVATDYYGSPLPDLAGRECRECGCSVEGANPDDLYLDDEADAVLHWSCWQEEVERLGTEGGDWV